MPEISKDLADKVIAANTRNVIKNVSDGGKLSPSERDMIRSGQLPGSTPEQLQQDRIASLLLKWSKGQRLSQEERSEIATFLPSDKRAMRAITKDSKQHTDAHYGTLYGCSDRAIKAWRKDGREAPNGPDLPPLDEPEKMAAWYARVKPARRVPAKLMALAKSPPKPAAGRTAPASPGYTAPQPQPPEPPAINAADFSYDLSVQYAAENLAYAQTQLRKARTIPDEATGLIDDLRVRDCENSVSKAASTYQKAKSDEHEHALRNGNLVDRRAVFHKLRERLNSMHQAMRSVPVRVGTKLALSPEVTRQIVSQMNTELDALFRQGSEDRWIFKDRLHLQ